MAAALLRIKWIVQELNNRDWAYLVLLESAAKMTWRCCIRGVRFYYKIIFIAISKLT